MEGDSRGMACTAWDISYTYRRKSLGSRPKVTLGYVMFFQAVQLGYQIPDMSVYTCAAQLKPAYPTHTGTAQCT
jgi:hypothetical protein